MDILLGKRNIQDCVKKTKQENLYILTGGTIPPNPAEVLSSKKMSEFIESIKDEYDYIFIDSPPVGVVSDASIISAYSDGVIFVVGAGATARSTPWTVRSAPRSRSSILR